MDVVLAALTLALVVITAWYAWATWRLLRVAERQRRDAALPVITFEIDDPAARGAPRDTNAVRVAAKNIGAGPALWLDIAWHPFSPCQLVPTPLPVALGASERVFLELNTNLVDLAAERDAAVVASGPLGELRITYHDLHGGEFLSRTSLALRRFPIHQADLAAFLLAESIYRRVKTGEVVIKAPVDSSAPSGPT